MPIRIINEAGEKTSSPAQEINKVDQTKIDSVGIKVLTKKAYSIISTLKVARNFSTELPKLKNYDVAIRKDIIRQLNKHPDNYSADSYITVFKQELAKAESKYQASGEKIRLHPTVQFYILNYLSTNEGKTTDLYKYVIETDAKAFKQVLNSKDFNEILKVIHDFESILASAKSLSGDVFYMTQRGIDSIYKDVVKQRKADPKYLSKETQPKVEPKQSEPKDTDSGEKTTTTTDTGEKTTTPTDTTTTTDDSVDDDDSDEEESGDSESDETKDLRAQIRREERKKLIKDTYFKHKKDTKEECRTQGDYYIDEKGVKHTYTEDKNGKVEFRTEEALLKAIEKEEEAEEEKKEKAVDTKYTGIPDKSTSEERGLMAARLKESLYEYLVHPQNYMNEEVGLNLQKRLCASALGQSKIMDWDNPTEKIEAVSALDVFDVWFKRCWYSITVDKNNPKPLGTRMDIEAYYINDVLNWKDTAHSAEIKKLNEDFKKEGNTHPIKAYGELVTDVFKTEWAKAQKFYRELFSKKGGKSKVEPKGTSKKITNKADIVLNSTIASKYVKNNIEQWFNWRVKAIDANKVTLELQKMYCNGYDVSFQSEFKKDIGSEYQFTIADIVASDFYKAPYEGTKLESLQEGMSVHYCECPYTFNELLNEINQINDKQKVSRIMNHIQSAISILGANDHVDTIAIYKTAKDYPSKFDYYDIKEFDGGMIYTFLSESEDQYDVVEIYIDDFGKEALLFFKNNKDLSEYLGMITN